MVRRPKRKSPLSHGHSPYFHGRADVALRRPFESAWRAGSAENLSYWQGVYCALFGFPYEVDAAEAEYRKRGDEIAAKRRKQRLARLRRKREQRPSERRA